MRPGKHPAVLAEAAAGLSHQLREQLKWMSKALVPYQDGLDRRFAARLRSIGFDRKQWESLLAITPGAAARCLAGGESLSAFLEKAAYRGRRLAKLGLTPAAVVSALGEYDELFDLEFERRFPDQADNLAWACNQLQFLVILSLNSAFYEVREAESHAFYELFRAEVESRTLSEMLPRFLSVLATYTSADEGRLYLLEPGEQTGQGKAATSGKEFWVLRASVPSAPPGVPIEATPALRAALKKPRSIEIAGEERAVVLARGWKRGFGTCWSMPLLSDGRLRGVLQFGFRKSYEWLPRELELLTAAAERCWLAAEKARLLEGLAQREEQVRRLAEHMVEVEESERRRISRELHDEAGQSLLTVRLQMEMLEQDLPAEFEPWRRRLVETREMTEHTIVEIRRLIAALSPAILEQMGLAAALRQLIGRFRMIHDAEVRMQLPRRLDLPKKVEIIIYRLVQEIFNNIAKYSMAGSVNLSVVSADGHLRLRVEDDGIGFDVQEAFSRRDCFGLSGLRERVALLGGTLEVSSLPKAKSAESAGEAVRPRASNGRKARDTGLGGIGKDRHGTSIRVELPIPVRGRIRRDLRKLTAAI